jgi:hypothetical protein
MQGNYALHVRHEVYEAIRNSSRTARDRALAFIESLCADPFHSGDYSEPDATGRDCQVKILGQYALFFWADHAVKEVRVIDLIDADRQ